MACFFIVDTHIDKNKGRGSYDDYIEQVKPIVESYGGEYLARSENVTALSPLIERQNRGILPVRISQLLPGNLPVFQKIQIIRDILSTLIIHELSEVAYVSVISMEMTGNAWINKDLVWVPYSEAFRACKAPIRNLLENGINVKLYNFPLCTVDQEYWPLCEKSISPEKVRFTDECCQCRYQRSCGGIFAGTLMLEREELKHIP